MAAILSILLFLAPQFDLVIRNGTVVDGSGGKARRADVGIKDGRIVRIGSLKRAYAREVIDASGLIIAPGFDRNTVADRATYAAPHQFPVGIPYVIVNGVVVVRDGKHTGARPGHALSSRTLQP